MMKYLPKYRSSSKNVSKLKKTVSTPKKKSFLRPEYWRFPGFAVRLIFHPFPSFYIDFPSISYHILFISSFSYSKDFLYISYFLYKRNPFLHKKIPEQRLRPRSTINRRQISMRIFFMLTKQKKQTSLEISTNIGIMKILCFKLKKGVKIQENKILPTAREFEVSRICRPIDFPLIFHLFPSF